MKKSNFKFSIIVASILMLFSFSDIQGQIDIEIGNIGRITGPAIKIGSTQEYEITLTRNVREGIPSAGGVTGPRDYVHLILRTGNFANSGKTKTVQLAKGLRTFKIQIDWSQNYCGLYNFENHFNGQLEVYASRLSYYDPSTVIDLFVNTIPSNPHVDLGYTYEETMKLKKSKQERFEGNYYVLRTNSAFMFSCEDALSGARTSVGDLNNCFNLVNPDPDCKPVVIK